MEGKYIPLRYKYFRVTCPLLYQHHTASEAQEDEDYNDGDGYHFDIINIKKT